jgi:Fe-S cluster assembly ATP-binding protein
LDNLLTIEDLSVETDGQEILQGLCLTVKKGEIHAIMGPNGSGKSTLAKVLAGHPSYQVTKGAIFFRGESLLNLTPEERFLKGLFMSFQYPVEVSGVANSLFLKISLNTQRTHQGLEPLDEPSFLAHLDQAMTLSAAPPSFKERHLNQGFSGGEKKKNEILQMALFQPILSVLDETDSGLDIDAIRSVGQAVRQMRKETNAFILITHYQRLLNEIQPHFVHVLDRGKIVQTGGPELALALEQTGYR